MDAGSSQIFQQAEDEDDTYSEWSARFLLVRFGSEDLEKYRSGGYHPVHLGDLYDNDRYKVVHKLGSGGFSTVWLARDRSQNRWVALKFVTADCSQSILDKVRLGHGAAVRLNSHSILLQERHFLLEGPNGTHVCLVLPVLGPAASQTSDDFRYRLRPRLAQAVSMQVTQALAGLHSQGVCHGDATTNNVILGLVDIDRYNEQDIYHVLGPPETDELHLESGEPVGLDAPVYIVKAIDFLRLSENLIKEESRLTDFDQTFAIDAPPEKMLGTPTEFLAPEVAVGQKPGPASDVWALGCTIFRLRSGACPFTGYEVTSPSDLMRVIVQFLGDPPASWGETLFDYYGQPTKDTNEGEPLLRLDGHQRLDDIVNGIWDEPPDGIVDTGQVRPLVDDFNEAENAPLPSSFSHMFWRPTATRVDNIYFYGYADETEDMLKFMPKISQHEAKLLLDLLSKIFVYEPGQRISAAEMLEHPWFKLAD